MTTTEAPIPNLMLKVDNDTLDALLNLAEAEGNDVCAVARRIIEDALRTAKATGKTKTPRT